MKNIELKNDELEELKLIIEYALKKGYGVVYEDIQTTLLLMNEIFTEKEIVKIKDEYIIF